jgi:hypothetical protein
VETNLILLAWFGESEKKKIGLMESRWKIKGLATFV